MLYKVTGVWGNHEGSMLLWCLILALFGALGAWFGGDLPERLRARVLAVQGSIGVAFLAFSYASLRRIEDISEASRFEMAAALVSGDPRIMELAAATRDVERFTRLQVT